MYPLVDLEQMQMKQNLPAFRAGDTQWRGWTTHVYRA